ncbi:MAG: hypothetical protein COV71_06255 [Candidatus Omnitrophica bacterium CG11_big_fil_rev_8_21_14_0_20_41_12]|nr:MAG: hypothetical protein COV71_06255 [Candidatus Omnitrophica bacterium CG11_big_fil_rev_8_21_14_0_20_41_12]
MYIISKYMDKPILPKFLITIVSITCVLFLVRPLYAEKEKDGLYLQGRSYRQAGLESQRVGNLADAMALYQKAIAVDPGYAEAYNDLGIIYEAMGSAEKAEECYLKAIKIDPAYISVYTNLALLYESKRDLEKAAYYWNKRVQIGSADDPWTQKAADRLKDIRIVLSKHPIADLREGDVLSLMQDVSADKTSLTKDDLSASASHFKKAKECFKKGDLATAIKEALDAQYLDPKNKEIEAFIEKTELRALSR